MGLADALGQPSSYVPHPPPKWAGWAWSRAALVLTAFLHTVAFPPHDVPEAAWVFATPALLWCIQKPRWSEFLVVIFGAMFVSWMVLLFWLRHVTMGGTIALAVVMALYPTAWFAAARHILPKSSDADHTTRIFSAAGLAGLWVVLEWVRSWFLTGFPWLPLAASQWQRPMMLQSAAIGGAWMISFALIFFNLGLTAYLRRIQLWVRERKGRFCPEFYLAMFVMFAISFGAFIGAVGEDREKLFTVGMVQPDIPQSVKWEPSEATNILSIIAHETRQVVRQKPDIILWPEAVTPIPINDEPAMTQWLKKLTDDIRTPILFGAVGLDGPAAGVATGNDTPIWRNGVFLSEPYLGLEKTFYAKRHLVPFGEYVPLGRVLGFIKKFVPIGDDFVPGDDASPIVVNLNGRTTRIGALVCYEDVFTALARDEVREGADVLFVATNDAWYGEEGETKQHAAHSVLRAVETRRPVMRVGNDGWSGWFDEYGRTRAVMIDDQGSVYYRGGAAFAIDRDPHWAGRQTTYVRFGDWFVLVSAVFVVFGWMIVDANDRRARALETRKGSER